VSKSLRIDIRDPRLRGGRMDLTADTDSEVVRDARKDALLKLLETERGRGIIHELRARRLKIADVQRAVEAMDLTSLERKAEAAAKKARPTAPPPPTLGAVIDRFLLRLESHSDSEKTHENYRITCRQLEGAFGVHRSRGGEIVRDVEVSRITSLDCEQWLHGPKETTGGKPWSARTQRRAHAVASQVWDLALVEDEERAEKHDAERTLLRNPWRKQGPRPGVRPPRARQTRVEFLSRNEAARLLWVNRHTPRALLCALGVYAGLRASEAANLRLSIDVDLEKGVLRIQARKGRYEWSPKTERSQRTIPMSRKLARWIRLHIADGYAGDVYLIHPAGGDRPIERSTVQKWTREAFGLAGIRYGRKKDALTNHSLRHTFASWLTQKNQHPKKIAALLGDTVQIVLDTYSHLVDEDLAETVEVL
jgi:integrase